MNRFAGYFILILIGSACLDAWFGYNYSFGGCLLGAALATGFAYVQEYFELLAAKLERSQEQLQHVFEHTRNVTNFCDAAADTLMKIRYDLAELKGEKDREKSTHEKFIDTYNLAKEYPYGAVATEYRTEEGIEGKIIIRFNMLSKTFGRGRCSTESFASTVIYAENEIKIGGFTTVEIYEPQCMDVPQWFYATVLDAKVIDEDLILDLNMGLTSSEGYMCRIPDEEAIKRQIRVASFSKHNITIKHKEPPEDATDLVRKKSWWRF